MKATMLRQPFATRQFKKVLAFAPDSKDKPAVKAMVKFSIKKKIPFGSSIAVVGECKQLGSWDVASAQYLSWSEDHLWTGEAELLPEPTSYKYVVVSKEGVEWQPSSNLQITPSSTKMICVEDSWEGSSHIVEFPTSSTPASPVEAVPEAKATEETAAMVDVISTTAATTAEVSIPTAAPVDLSKKTLKALRAMCTAKNLPITGSKKELVARIHNA